ncbi:SDR family oxidoreductase [Henriciella sp. AS95]|uniref:SDR family NAD(P)-dependent oxidoreductase n=1 Tax=Henriciella sp. AS95 TaxID=3135782 RepID=UPI00316BE63F
MQGLDGKIHVITGGYGGIAMATARFLLKHGGRVVLTGRDAEKGRAAIAALSDEFDGRVHFYEQDVTDPQATDVLAGRIEQEVGPVWGVVANAAGAWPGNSFDLSAEDWRKTFAVNLDGAFYTAQAFARNMRGRGGSVVMVSSIAGTINTIPLVVASYSTSKAGMSFLAARLGIEWAREGIRVNAVEPGHIDTELTAKARARRPDMIERWISEVPMQRLLDPEEVAHSIAFLLSDLSSGMTASTLTVDGGYSRC